MSMQKKIRKSSAPFPFKPPEYQPPPPFPGCICDGVCKCKYQDVTHMTQEGVFVPFAPSASVCPPKVCVWGHLTREDYKNLEFENFGKEAAFRIFEKKFPLPPKGTGKNVTLELLYEALRFSRVNNMNNKKSSALVSIYFNTHQFFISSLWRTPEETYNYFKECILLHTVQRPPKSTEILQPDESHNALRHFVNVYLRHLALVAISCLPAYRLQLIWPSRPLSAETQREETPGEGEVDPEGRLTEPKRFGTQSRKKISSRVAKENIAGPSYKNKTE